MAQITISLSRLISKRVKFNYNSLATFSAVNFISNEKDLSVIDNSKSQDTLLQTLKVASNPYDVFSVVSKNRQSFNQKHTLQALRSLFELSKESNQNIDHFLKDPTFEQLCMTLKKHSRALDLNETIEAIKILSYLKVPTNSTIYQMLLQLIRQNINSLNLKQIMFLSFVFSKAHDNHLINALRLALPLAFQINLTTYMEEDNVPHLVDLLKFSSMNNIPDRFISNIVTCLILNECDINIHQAESILISMCQIGIPDADNSAIDKLLKICYNIVSQNLNDVSYTEMIRLLNLVKEKISDKENIFYNERFLDSCGSYVIKKDLGFTKGMFVGKILSRIAHTHLALLEYLSQSLIIEPDILPNIRPVLLFSYINALSNANYQPQYWDQIKTQLFLNPITTSNNIKLPWTKFAVELASLGVYNNKLLKKIFNEDFLNEYLSRDYSMLDYIQLQLICQAVSEFYPSYTGDFPPSDIIAKATEITYDKMIDEDIKVAVSEALGGSDYNATSVIMPGDIFVEFVVAFDDKNSPTKLPVMSSSDKIIRFEDLAVSNSTHHIICILPFHKGCYSLNNKRLRGHFNLIVRILEHKGYSIVPLNLMEWRKMPESERIPYIRREIYSKYPLNSNIYVKNI